MSEPELGRLIGSGREAEVFEYGRTILKLYRSEVPKRSAFREAAILAIVESLEVPAPRALGVREIGERWGVIMSRVEGTSFADALFAQPALMPDYMKEMARLQLAVHRHAATLLSNLKARLLGNIRKATVLGSARQSALLDRLADMPDGDRLCHGDFHPLNILGRPGSASIVDWLDATRGEPAADACRSYLLIRHLDPTWASTYLDAYAAESGASPGNILDWLPLVAGARLAEDVPSEAEALMAMVDGAR
jgi:aminoglycoside phosphotransferase (APT) family kinase protein